MNIIAFHLFNISLFVSYIYMGLTNYFCFFIPWYFNLHYWNSPPINTPVLWLCTCRNVLCMYGIKPINICRTLFFTSVLVCFFY